MTTKDILKVDIQNLEISEFLIANIVNKYVQKNNLQDYVLNIDLSGKYESASTLGRYSSLTKTISINLPYYKYTISIIKNDLFDKSSSKNLQYQIVYSSLLHTIYHELIHAKQHRDKDTNELPFDIYLLFFDSYTAPDNLYLKHHDLFPTEFNADMESYLEMLKSNIGTDFMNKFTKAKLFKTIYDSYIIKKGEITSPSERFYKIIKKEMPSFSKYELDKRINYGLPITIEEYKSKRL